MLKKGYRVKFCRGNLAKVASRKTKFTGFFDFVALWNAHPKCTEESEVLNWDGSRVSSHVKKDDILFIIDIHNLEHPSKKQYCHVMCSRTNESGWVLSEYLEKIQ